MTNSMPNYGGPADLELSLDSVGSAQHPAIKNPRNLQEDGGGGARPDAPESMQTTIDEGLKTLDSDDEEEGGYGMEGIQTIASDDED